MARRDRHLAKYAANRAAIVKGAGIADGHPLVWPLPDIDLLLDAAAAEMGPEEWLRVEVSPPPRWANSAQGTEPECRVRVRANLRRREDPEAWAYVLGRMRMHAALNHLDPRRPDPAWHHACWLAAEEMISAAGVGRRPAEMPPIPSGLPRSEVACAEHVARHGASPDLAGLSLGRPGEPFWRATEPFDVPDALTAQRASQFARGVRAAASQAVDVAGGLRDTLGRTRTERSAAERAREWAISEMPLLAALAASFTLVTDETACYAARVPVAAICDATREIFRNPRVVLSEAEERFVMAHELLHAGLRHTPRRQGRDPWLWNVACDFVINDWLIEMQVGEPPEQLGYLFDAELRGLSAEEVYDRITADLRMSRKLRKARGLNGGCPDMLEGDRSPAWWRGGGTDLDAFYRRALREGLDLHRERGRGTLPLGLVEEIRALSQPPIPWEVELGRWLDAFFPPLERRRSYARAHRRQSATPNIPRPAWVAPDEARRTRVFGCVLDSSASMSRADLGRGVGAVASYAMAREVAAIRLIHCDAAPHDAGWVEPERLLDRVEIRGRGGTVLAPGLRFLERLADFPRDAPILVITDGACDAFATPREHAVLLASRGGRLPFKPEGPVFHMS